MATTKKKTAEELRKEYEAKGIKIATANQSNSVLSAADDALKRDAVKTQVNAKEAQILKKIQSDKSAEAQKKTANKSNPAGVVETAERTGTTELKKELKGRYEAPTSKWNAYDYLAPNRKDFTKAQSAATQSPSATKQQNKDAAGRVISVMRPMDNQTQDRMAEQMRLIGNWYDIADQINKGTIDVASAANTLSNALEVLGGWRKEYESVGNTYMVKTINDAEKTLTWYKDQVRPYYEQFANQFVSQKQMEAYVNNDAGGYLYEIGNASGLEAVKDQIEQYRKEMEAATDPVTKAQYQSYINYLDQYLTLHDAGYAQTAKSRQEELALEAGRAQRGNYAEMNHNLAANPTSYATSEQIQSAKQRNSQYLADSGSELTQLATTYGAEDDTADSTIAAILAQISQTQNQITDLGMQYSIYRGDEEASSRISREIDALTQKLEQLQSDYARVEDLKSLQNAFEKADKWLDSPEYPIKDFSGDWEASEEQKELRNEAYEQDTHLDNINAAAAAQEFDARYNISGIESQPDYHALTDDYKAFLQDLENHAQNRAIEERLPFQVSGRDTMALWHVMDEQQLRRAEYLWKTQGIDVAMRYIQDYAGYDTSALQANVDELAYQRNQSLEKESIENMPWLARGVYTTISAAGSPFAHVSSAIVSVAQDLFGNGADPYQGIHLTAKQIDDTIGLETERIREKYGTFAGDLVSAYFSRVSSAAAMATGNVAGGVVMGLSAFDSAYDEFKQRGADKDAAFLTAALAGIYEGLFESWSWEKLVKAGQYGSWKEFFKNFPIDLAKLGFNEGSEEFNTELANILTEGLLLSDRSRWAEYLRQYGEEGAASMLAKDIGQAAVVGMLSGMIGYPIAGAINTGRNARVNQTRGAINDIQKAADAAVAELKKNSLSSVNTQTKRDAAQGRLTSMRVSEEGKTSLESTGEGVTINKITAVGDSAKVEVKTGDGTTKEVSPSDLAYESDAQREAVAYAQEMENTDLANAFLATVGTSADINQTATQMPQVYRAASRNKVSREYFNSSVMADGLSAHQIDAAYNLGVKDYDATFGKVISDETERIKQLIGSKNWAGGTLTIDKSVDALNLSENDQFIVELGNVLAGTFGTNVNIFKTAANAEGRFDMGTAQGYYDSSTNTIGIDLNAGKTTEGDSLARQAILTTLAHEMTHAIQKNSPGLYARLKSAVIEVLEESGIDIEERISHMIEIDSGLQKAADPYTAAMDELVAQACENMLTDSDVFSRLEEKHPEAAKTFKAKVKELVGKLADALRKVFGVQKSKSVIAEIVDKSEKGSLIRQLWEEGVMNASDVAGRTNENATDIETKTEEAIPHTEEAPVAETKRNSNLVGLWEEPARDPELHIDKRDFDTVGDKSVPAFANVYPMSRMYFAYAANVLATDASMSIPGKRFMTEDGEFMGQKRLTTDVLARLKDETGMTWDAIQSTLDSMSEWLALDPDNDAVPNTAPIKRAEIALDMAMSKGYSTLFAGKLPPDRGWLEYKRSLPGANTSLDIPESAEYSRWEDLAEAGEMTDEQDLNTPTANESYEDNAEAFNDSVAAVQNQVRPPYTDGTQLCTEFVDGLNEEARKTYDMFYNFYQASRVGKTNLSSKFMFWSDWNSLIDRDASAAEAAKKMASTIPDSVRERMNMDKDGRLTPTSLEREFKMNRSMGQRLVDALELETIDPVYTIDGHTYRLTKGNASMSVGGEAYRRAICEEVRRAYRNGTLKQASIGTLSKDRWGSLGFLAANTKTGASGDFTTLCPQMFYNRGCHYCYRLASLTTGVNNKLVGANVWYGGEILRIKDADVERLNRNGGLRIQSFGDWMPQFSAQLADMLYDAEMRGLQIKIITKEPSMIEYVAELKEQGLGKNLYFNLSADYAFERAGKTETEDYTTFNADRLYFRDDSHSIWWKRSMTVQEANRYRQKYPWVNTRIVATTQEEFLRGLRDPTVDVVTGYHGKIRDWERIDSETGEVKVNVEPLGDAGMPVFAYDAATNEWSIEYPGKTKVAKQLAEAIQKAGLQYEYYIKTCCITGRCASCNGKCGKLAKDFNVKNATNRDTESVQYWWEQANQNTDIQYSSLAETEEASDRHTQYSVRESDPPRRTITVYKAFDVVDGKLYPPMVKNDADPKNQAGKVSTKKRASTGWALGAQKNRGKDTPVGVWLDAEVGAMFRNPDGTVFRNSWNRLAVVNAKGDKLSFRPGWHLGEIPDAEQFLIADRDGNEKSVQRDDVVYCECEVSADYDYQLEALSYGFVEPDLYKHTAAGLPRVPTDGYYKYRTNPTTGEPWVIAGSMKITRILTDDECRLRVAEYNAENGTNYRFPNRYHGSDFDFERFGLEPGEVAPTEDLSQYAKSERARQNEIELEEELAKIKAESDATGKGGYISRPLDFDSQAVKDAFEKNKVLKSLDEYRRIYEQQGVERYDENSNIQYQIRDTEDISDREILENALSSSELTDIEREWLNRYNIQLQTLAEDEARLNDERVRIDSLMKDKLTPSELRKLQKALITVRDINAWAHMRSDEEKSNMEEAMHTVDEIASENNLTNAEVKEIRESATAIEGLRRKVNRSKSGLRGMEKDTNSPLRRVIDTARKSMSDRRKDTLRSLQVKASRDKLLKRITQNVKELDKMLRTPSDKKHLPDEFRSSAMELIQPFLNENSIFSKKKLAELQVAYNYIKSLETDASHYHDQDIVLMLEEISGSIDGKRIKQLSRDELDTIYNVIAHFMKMAKDANTLFYKGKRTQVKELAEQVESEVSSKAVKARRRGQLPAMYRQLKEGNLTPPYFFKRLGGVLGDLGTKILEGESRLGLLGNEYNKRLLDIEKRYDHAAWANDKATLILNTENGESVELNREEALALYASYKRETSNIIQNAKHLEAGGIIKQGDARALIGKKELENANGTKITAADMTKVTQWLTQKQKDYADAMVKLVSSDLSALGNEVSKRLFGWSKFTEGYYYPYKTPSDMLKTNLSSSPDAPVLLRSASFTKGTVRNAKTPIVLTNFTDTIGNHVAEMLTFVSLAEAQDNFMRVFNRKLRDNVTVQSILATHYGSEVNRYITQFMLDLHGGYRSDFLEKVYNKMVSRMKRAAVFGNLSVFIQQPSSIGRAFALVDPKYFANRPKRGSWNECLNYCGTAVIKSVGRFDTDVGQTFGSWLVDDGSSRTLTGKIDSVLGYPPEKADMVTWGVIWEAVKNEQAEKTGLSRSSEELKQLAGKRFDEVIRLTQVYDSVMAKSQHMRSKSGISKTFTAFMAEPTVTYNMAVDAWADARQRNYKGAGRTLGGIAVSIVLNSLLKAIPGGMRDDDDDESVTEKYAQSFIGDIAESVNPFTYVPFVKDVYSIFQGYDVERADMSTIADLKKYLDKVTDEDSDYVTRLKFAAYALGNITGMPVQNVWRDIESVFSTVGTFAAGNQNRPGWLKYAAMDAVRDSWALTGKLVSKDDKASNAERLLDALIDGDADEAADVREHMTEYIKVGGRPITEKEIQSALKTAIGDRYVNGELTREQTEKMLNEYGGVKKSGIDKAMTELDFKADTNGRVLSSLKSYYLSEEGEENHMTRGEVIDAMVNRQGKTTEEAKRTVAGWDYEAETGIAVEGLKDAYLDGELSDKEALEAMQKYSGKNSSAANDTLDDWKFESKYGFAPDKVKQLYIDGKITKDRAAKLRAESSGKTADEVESDIRKWEYDKATGKKYDDLDDDYLEGDVSRKELINAWMKYGGKDEDEAEKAALKLDYQKDTGMKFSDMDKDYISGRMSRDQFKKYQQKYNGKDKVQAETAALHDDYTRDTGNEWSDLDEEYRTKQISRDQYRKYLMQYDTKDSAQAEKEAKHRDYEIQTGRMWSDLEDEYNEGLITQQQVVSILKQYDEQSEDQATKQAKKWSMYPATGTKYTEMKTEYLRGNLTDAEAIRLRKNYGSMSEADAYWDVEEWKYLKSGKTDWDGVDTKLNKALQSGNMSTIKTALQEWVLHNDYANPASTITQKITAYYKPLYRAATASQRAQMEATICDCYELAYTLCGKPYYGDSKHLKNIRKWLEDD